jgi:uncharacterized protein (DUF983 family)
MDISNYLIAAMVSFIFLSMFIKGFFHNVKVTKTKTASEVATWLVVYLAFPLLIVIALFSMQGPGK